MLVTTRSFTDDLSVGDPVSQAKIYEAQRADELIVLDIDSAPVASDETMLNLISRLASETFMPLTVGGGVRSVEDFATLLRCGADKVTINELAIDRPELVTIAAERFGSQSVVVSIDFRIEPDGRALVYRDRARIRTGVEVVEWSQEMVRRGAGELLLTDAGRDGTGTGLNCEVGRRVAESVTVPTILSGGCGLAEHFVAGFHIGAQAVAAGTFFCFRDVNFMQTRAHIRNAGISIRMET